MVGASPHILVVDDDRDVREVLCDLLSEEGFPVSTAAGGLAGLLRIGRDRPDCVVLDLKLDDISGFEIYRVLREDPDFRALPILLISGAYSDEEWVRKQVGTGPMRYLAKPIDHEDLVNVVRSLTL
jgi:CheY-like chemotaxis protein